MADTRPHLAYVFERFPSFTQTFCVREILELERQGLRPLIFSIRDTRGEIPRHFPDALYERVHFLPPEKELVDSVKQLKSDGHLPQSAVLALREWKDRPDTRDKQRLYEAAWIGWKMREAGVRHAHSHFAGVGARTAWWLRRLHGFTYSFTGHANDLWSRNDLPLTLADLMRDASLVATVSDYSARDLRERFPEAAAKVRRVYNGLDLAPFRAAAARRDPAAVWQAPGGPLILSVGRLIEKKGFDDLIRACARLRDCGAGPFRCVIVGDGPLETELADLIRQLDIADRVTLAGPRSQPEIIDLLQHAALFALPCVTEADGGKDNLPTVLMEAMAARVACASTRLAGVPEMVIDGITGRLVDERRPDDFAGILAEMIASPDTCETMGRAGEERAARLFAQEATARSLRRLLIGHGLTRFDPGLVARDPITSVQYARQMPLRIRQAFWKAAHREKSEIRISTSETISNQD
ncbi:MAG: glycosyltransferase family 4 protein [Verrucomicrobiales bacterium]|nr:glycosyltransferase family 4 protein [Verrucomicrobiales bacterium]